MTTALVVVDLQNAFCSATGTFVRRGFRIHGIAELISSSRRLIAHAEASDWFVVFTRLAYAHDYRDAGRLVEDNPEIRDLGGYVDGSLDSALVESLGPPPSGALVMSKTRYDPFAGTRLESELRARDVDAIVICGVTTNVCVESTVRRAHDLDFSVRIAADATSSYDRALHRASLETMSRHFGRVARVADLIVDTPVAT